MDMKSNLAKAKGLGAARNGTKVWWMQRLTSIALIPIMVWFVVMVMKVTRSDNLSGIIDSPFNIVMLLLLTIVGLYHATLGMIEVLEDYVHCKVAKFILLTLLKFLSFFTAVFSLTAILVFHLTIFTSK